jgi:putative ABC transport system permease protein
MTPSFYRWSLRFLPASLRHDHHDEMLAMVRERLHGRKGLRRVATYVAEIADLYRTVIREGISHRRTVRSMTGTEAGAGNRDFKSDFRSVWRSLRRRPGYAVVVMAILALGIAATSAAFTVVNGVLLRPLPYADSDRLALVWTELDRSTDPTEMTVSPADFVYWKASTTSFEILAAHNLWHPVLSGDGGDARTIMAGLVTPELFHVLGVQPLLGRTFRPEESQTSATVTVLSNGLWRSRYGSDPAIVGKLVTLNGVPHEIVGVLPADYRHPDPHRPLIETQLFKPFDMSEWPHDLSRYLRVIGRLAPGVSIERAEAEMDAIAIGLEAIRPERNSDTGTIVYSMREQFYASSRPALLLVLTGAGLVYLIVLANVANLVLTRSLSRKREFAVRASLGAGRMRIAHQMLMENGLLALGGSALGLGAVLVSMDLLTGLQGRYLPRIGDIQLDLRVALFTVMLTILTTVLLGMLPLGEFFRTPLRAVLSEEAPGAGGSRRSRRIRALLVVGEVALAAALVVGAGLLGRSFQNLAAVGPGFDAPAVLTAEITAPPDRYQSSAEYLPVFEQLGTQFSALPEVDVVGFASQLPMLDGDWTRDFEVIDQPRDRAMWPTAEIRFVSPAYFEAMRIELVAGRPFSNQDRAGAQSVVVVNEEFATAHWAPGNAVGKSIRWERNETMVVSEVVGVVADVLDDGLTASPDPFIYYPFAQYPRRSAAFAIRTTGPPTAIAQSVRRMIRAVDSEIPVDIVDSYQSRIQGTIAGPRFASSLAMVFSALALVIAGLGIYGVMSYAVEARTREIGIRAALGARGSDVVSLIVRQGIGLTLVGVILGLAFAAAVGRGLSSILFGVSVGDPLSYLSAPAVLVVVAMVASYLPARRALAVELVDVLRSDGR